MAKGCRLSHILAEATAAVDLNMGLRTLSFEKLISSRQRWNLDKPSVGLSESSSVQDIGTVKVKKQDERLKSPVSCINISRKIEERQKPTDLSESRKAESRCLSDPLSLSIELLLRYTSASSE